MIKKVNDIELYYEEYGEGKPLLLLHGNGENVEIFYKLIEKLKLNYKIYAIDSRNHGKSTKTNDFSYNTMAKDIEEFIKQLGERVSILGFSDGAVIAIIVAITNPELLDKLILLGPNLTPEAIKEEIVTEIREMYEKTNDDLFKLMLTEPQIALEDFKNIYNEMLFIFAEDEMFSEEAIEEMITSAKNAKSLRIKGHDHLSYIVENDLIAEDVKEFLG